MTMIDPLSPPDLIVPSAIAPPPPPPFPNFVHAVLLSVMLVVAQIFFGAMLSVIVMIHGSLAHGGRPPEGVGLAMLALANVLGFLAVVGIAILWGKLRIREALPFRPIHAATLPAMAVTVVGLSVLLSDLSNLIMLFLPMPRVIAEVFGKVMGGESSVFWSQILVCVVAPFTEEPMFRGLLLGGLLRHRRPWAAIVVTSFLFAAIHLNPWQFMPALSLGLLFGWWFLRTRSLWPCIAGHALNNSLPQMLSIIPGLDIPGYTGSMTDEIQFQPLWFDLIGLILFVGGIAWTAHLFRQLPEPPTARPIALPDVGDPGPLDM